ncbi:hypothetical protein EV1_018632 [Malus domestica]
MQFKMGPDGETGELQTGHPQTSLTLLGSVRSSQRQRRHHPWHPHRRHRRPFDGRRLQRSVPNAHMRLYDNLLANGYYTTRLWIGTPPQQFALIVDTGSTVTYVPCFDCEQCGFHQDPRFHQFITVENQVHAVSR